MGAGMKGISEVIMAVVFMVMTALLSLIALPLLHQLLGTTATIDIVLKPKYFSNIPDHALRSLLLVSEETTNKSMQELLSLAASQGSKEVKVNLTMPSLERTELTVDIEHVIEKEVKFLVPGRDYYVTAGSLEFGTVKIKESYCSKTKITLPRSLEERDAEMCVDLGETEVELCPT